MRSGLRDDVFLRHRAYVLPNGNTLPPSWDSKRQSAPFKMQQLPSSSGCGAKLRWNARDPWTATCCCKCRGKSVQQKLQASTPCHSTNCDASSSPASAAKETEGVQPLLFTSKSTRWPAPRKRHATSSREEMMGSEFQNLIRWLFFGFFSVWIRQRRRELRVRIC